MREKIIEKLNDIESEYNVKILYACESGSRAWGFPSKDSDYDVRFIYVHNPDYYLTIDPVGYGTKRNVIEKPINDLLDINGWELTKALKLFRNFNPALMEWLESDIVYIEKHKYIEELSSYKNNIFKAYSSIYHYLNSAKGNYREYLQGDTVKIKKYFYVLRPILASLWIEKFNEFPPLDFKTLLNKTIHKDKELLKNINELFNRKINGDELDLEPRIEPINNFIEKEMERLWRYANSLEKVEHNPTTYLNGIFKTTLADVWGNTFDPSKS